MSALPTCDVCAGVGIPVSGKPCICGGSGYSHDEKAGLRKRVMDLDLQLRQAQAVIEKHVVGSIEGLHCVDCVSEHGDDCDCPQVVEIFTAMAGYEPKPKGCAHKNIEAFGEGFRKCKDCGVTEPPYPTGVVKPKQEQETSRGCICGPEGRCDYHAMTDVTVPVKRNQEGA